MSQENLEVVRAMIETFNLPGEEWLAFIDPAVEFSDAQAAVGVRDRGRGIDSLRQSSNELTEIFSEWNVEVRELVDLGDNRVLAELHYTAVGGESGARGSADQVDIYRLRNQKVVEYRAGYRSRKEAFEAAGLSE